MIPLLPARLNLAIARNCFVHCRGCYSFFGSDQPDLTAFVRSARAFVILGVDEVTLSGGDPLTIRGLPEFLADLRSVGARSIKVDTVGTGLMDEPGTRRPSIALPELLERVDVLGLPLDGWSNESVQAFRVGRPALFDETVALLAELGRRRPAVEVVVNTVAHRRNVRALRRILDVVLGQACVTHWRVFQYTCTDQAASRANDDFGINSGEFADASAVLRDRLTDVSGQGAPMPQVEFRSVESRLGDYLLINSDGEAWLPDRHGRTIRLGPVFGREETVLAHWREEVEQVTMGREPVPTWPPPGTAVLLREASA